MLNNICIIKLKAFDVKLLEKIVKLIIRYSNQINLKVSRIKLPTNIKKFTVLRSPHVHKKSREQFEIRTHKYLIHILNKNPKIDIKSFINRLDSELKQISGFSFKMIIKTQNY